MKKRTSKDIFADTLLALAKQESLERITVKQIVEESGLSLQTFYNHFHDKNELIIWIHQRVGERTLAKIEKGSYSFHELTEDVIRVFSENAGYISTGFGLSPENRYLELSAEIVYKLMAAFVQRRSGQTELSEEMDFYLRMYITAGLHVFSEWSRQTQGIPPERLAYYMEQGMPEKLKPYLLEP